MRINVTAEDIANGQPHRCSWCPVALALRRHLLAAKVSVASKIIVTLEDGTGFVKDTPLEACNFIRDFDNGRSVIPFTFDLPVGKG